MCIIWKKFLVLVETLQLLESAVTNVQSPVQRLRWMTFHFSPGLGPNIPSCSKLVESQKVSFRHTSKIF